MTARERDVIRLVNEGLGHHEIAARLHVSANTVKSHVHNIMEKIALHEQLDDAGSVYTKKTVKMIARRISTINN